MGTWREIHQVHIMAIDPIIYQTGHFLVVVIAVAAGLVDDGIDCHYMNLMDLSPCPLYPRRRAIFFFPFCLVRPQEVANEVGDFYRQHRSSIGATSLIRRGLLRRIRTPHSASVADAITRLLLHILLHLYSIYISLFMMHKIYIFA